MRATRYPAPPHVTPNPPPSTPQQPAEPRPPLRLAVLVVLAFLAILTATEYAYRPPAPLPKSAPADEFSSGRAADTLVRILGGGEHPHPLGSPGNAAVRERIVECLEELGLEPQVQTALVAHRHAVARVHNIVARIDGRQKSPALLLCAHHDSVGAGPGAADDGASVAAILETARALRRGPKPRFPIILLIDDGEELGLFGARAFCADHPWAKEVGAVLNFEARGTTGASLMFETSGEDRWLAEHAAAALPQPITGSAFAAVYRTLPNSTDLAVFREHQIPGLNFAFVGGARRYHTSLDDFAHLDLRSVQHQGENMLALARSLANSYDLAAPPPGHATYFDLFGRGIVVLPRELELPAAGMLVVAFVIVLGLRLHRRSLRPLGLLTGIALGPLAISLAAGVGALMALILRGMGCLPTPFPPDHEPYVLGYGLAGLATTAALLCLTRRRLDAWHTAVGVGMFMALLTTALAALWPGTGYLTAGAAAIGLLLATFGKAAATRRIHWCTGASVMLSAVALAPFFVLMPQALGLQAGAAHTAVAALAAVLFAPLLPALLGHRPWPTTLVLALTAVAAMGLANIRPPHTDTHPARTNIVHVAVAGRPGVWFLDDSTLPLRGHMARPLPFERLGLCLPAPQLDLPGPAVEIDASSSGIGNKRTVRAVLSSRRDAPWLSVWLPPGLSVEKVTLAGLPVTPARPTSAPGWRTFSFFGAEPGEELEVELTCSGTPAASAYVIDRTPGLPAAADGLAQRRAAGLAAPIHMGDGVVVATPVKAW
jgi:hypothetical protein